MQRAGCHPQPLWRQPGSCAGGAGARSKARAGGGGTAIRTGNGQPGSGFWRGAGQGSAGTRRHTPTRSEVHHPSHVVCARHYVIVIRIVLCSGPTRRACRAAAQHVEPSPAARRGRVLGRGKQLGEREAAGRGLLPLACRLLPRARGAEQTCVARWLAGVRGRAARGARDVSQALAPPPSMHRRLGRFPPWGHARDDMSARQACTAQRNPPVHIQSGQGRTSPAVQVDLEKKSGQGRHHVGPAASRRTSSGSTFTSAGS